MKWLASVWVGLICAATLTAQFADSPVLGAKVVEFCKTHLGEKVGNGQCAGLATQALKAAGAKVRPGPDSPNPGDYVWGRQVYLLEGDPAGLKETGKLSDVRPGDIMQYRDVKFGPRRHAAHHTAVVAEVDADTRKVKVYQQNVGGKQVVTEGSPPLDRISEGWIRFYRPFAEPR